MQEINQETQIFNHFLTIILKNPKQNIICTENTRKITVSSGTWTGRVFLLLGSSLFAYRSSALQRRCSSNWTNEVSIGKLECKNIIFFNLLWRMQRSSSRFICWGRHGINGILIKLTPINLFFCVRKDRLRYFCLYFISQLTLLEIF